MAVFTMAWYSCLYQAPSLSLCIALLLAYLVLVTRLRFRRAERTTRMFFEKRNSLNLMTLEDAQRIMKDLVELEFPKFMGFSIVFALFKTYGLPGVSSLLVSTGELSSSANASKRTADTGVLLFEFALNNPYSDRAIKAITRMNYLHENYIKAGKITNSSLLYTLSVFALEPLRWVSRYEWRQLSDVEICASGTYWKAIGDAMKISYDEHPPLEDCASGLQWITEIRAWSEEYERQHMVPADTNSQLANAHLDVIFVNLPPVISTLGKRVVSVLVGERLRVAMKLPRPSNYWYKGVDSLLKLRKLLLRYLALPRSEMLRKDYAAELDKSSGRLYAKEYLSYPWYVRPTLMRRWGPRALILRLLQRKLPGDDGNSYAPNGFIVTEVGPKQKKNRGLKDMEQDELRIREQWKQACPFHGLR
ncbi:MAG: hypothetical protein M1828_003210 [Chrysothrix sp. TS-e1954]|nr:MAG: hypothetical protein M1828_003210 [Chrysothrix sp. TS-e1954]